MWGSNYTGSQSGTSTWTSSAYFADSDITFVNFYSSTSNNLYITGVQLEVGDAASDFEHLPTDVQLRRCMRYCVSYSSNVGDQRLVPNAAYIASGFMYTSSAAIGVLHFPVPMNHEPTLTTSNATDSFQFYRNNAGDALDDLTISASSSNIAAGIVNSTDASGSAGHAGGFYIGDSTMIFEAEL